MPDPADSLMWHLQHQPCNVAPMTPTSWSFQKKTYSFIVREREFWILAYLFWSGLQKQLQVRLMCKLPTFVLGIDLWCTLQSLSKHGLNSAARFVDLRPTLNFTESSITIISNTLQTKGVMACILDARSARLSLLKILSKLACVSIISSRSWLILRCGKLLLSIFIFF